MNSILSAESSISLHVIGDGVFGESCSPQMKGSTNQLAKAPNLVEQSVLPVAHILQSIEKHCKAGTLFFVTGCTWGRFGPDLQLAKHCARRSQGALLSGSGHAARPPAMEGARQHFLFFLPSHTLHSNGCFEYCGNSEKRTKVCSAATKRPRRQEPATCGRTCSAALRDVADTQEKRRLADSCSRQRASWKVQHSKIRNARCEQIPRPNRTSARRR